ncbi:MAG: substrate-binding domain-containing protein [Bacteroidales bacterium]|jgi:putative multiple sugar transport system substrate-binding protein|nr:substrate-binding domain-containing protein [Bacteroidales bacterium]
MKKHLLGKLLLFTALALQATACVIIVHDSKDQKVAVLLPDTTIIDRWAADKQNLKTVMGKYGFNTTFYIAPETAEGAVQQVDQLREAIKDGAKYIVLTAIDYTKINESGLLEQNPDVKLVCHDRFVPDNPHITYISSTDTKEIGRMQAMFLLNHYHSSGAKSMTIEFLEGPETDINAKDYFEGAMELLKKYIDNGNLVVKSGKKDYSQVKADSWDIADGKKSMQNRLDSYKAGERPDMVLAANDNLAQGAIEALTAAGITDMPIITGQDNTTMAQNNIKDGKQAMTIDKNLNDMAYNTALIINSLISHSPVQTSQHISVGEENIPVLYSKITLMTIDSY